MKKIISLFAVLFCTAAAQAHTVDATAAYTGASHFDKVHVRALTALTLNVQAGLEATWANEHRLFKDPVYSAAMPLVLNFELMQFQVRPFYYFKNKSDQPAFQDAQAFGVETKLLLTLNDDTVNDLYTRAFLGASFARQKGTVFFKDDPDSNQYYSQAAYTFGLAQDFYQAFTFRVAGTAFQYPNGIHNVAGVRSILDQQQLADTQTLDIVHDLAKYALSARITRQWSDTGASFYLAYRFAEYYTADSQHSVLVGNSFPITSQISLGVAYNHLRSAHNTDKRDIGQARLEILF